MARNTWLGTKGWAALALPVVLIGASISGASAAHATDGEITVCATGCDYTTLATAVAAATPGSTVRLSAGEHSVPSRVTVTKPLNIVGPNAGVNAVTGARAAEATIVTAGGTAGAWAIGVSSNDITIDGLTFADAGVVGGGTPTNITIQNNRLLNNASVYTEQAGSSNWSVLNNDISPGVNGNNSGLNLTNVNGLTISGNRIQNTGFAAMNLSFVTNTVVSDNYFANTPMQAVHLHTALGTATVTGNVFDSNDTANEAGRGALIISNGATVAHVEVTGNTFRNSNRAVNLSSNLPPSGVSVNINENTFENNTINIANRSLVPWQVDATLNWWGTATPDLASTITGNVLSSPFYTSADRSSRSDTVQTSVSVTTPRTMVPGAALQAAAAVSPTATGTLELLVNGSAVASSSTPGAPVEFDLSGLSSGAYELQGRFTSSDTLAFTSSASAPTELAVSPAGPPAPVVDSDALDQLIEELGLDPAATADSFVPQGGAGSNSDLGDLDPSKPLVGEIPWASDDAFVDVFAYSTPVFIGSFPVIDGKLQLSADISGLPSGEHRLVFIGQTSGDIQAMDIAVRSSATPGSGGGTASGGGTGAGAVATPATASTSTVGAKLAATGADSPSASVLGAAGATLLLGAALVMGAALRRRAHARQSANS